MSACAGSGRRSSEEQKRPTASFLLWELRSSDGVAALANLGRRRTASGLRRLDRARIWPERVIQGFCRSPLFCEPKGDEKSFAGDPAGSAQYSQPASSRP